MAVIVEVLLTACAERASVPVILPDSTIVYLPKKAGDISADIILCRKVYQKTGQRIGKGTIFGIREKENLFAFIELENRFLHAERELMFHIDWIDPEGRSFYQKEIDLAPEDSSSTLNSSISISPDKRQSGKYLLRVYYFRELIAEKKFELRPEAEMEKVRADFIFYKSLDKESGELNGVDTAFAIRKKGILRVQIGFTNLHVYKDDELPFRLEWIGPDGQSFYKKQINLLPGDTSSSINSSISITPDKRQPGNYFLRIYLFDEMIAEKRFELLSEE
jgi:hypothetical protein